MKLSKTASIVCVLLLVGVVLGACAIGLVAAASDRNGKVAGLVLDANDARIVNAAVTLEHGRIKRRLKSDDKGEFGVALPPGNYQLTVEADGFRKFSSLLMVKADETKRLDVHLKVAEPTGLVPAFRQ
jgi:hypothetical protein